jgi:2-amino-4-hydroxy-6-hydroxymethyldihydropteridine diphosphokinase
MELGLSFGSNVGDRLAHLVEGKRRVLDLKGVQACAQSPVYETEPVGMPAAARNGPFLNAALVVRSRLPVRDLLLLLQQIEADLGRSPAERRRLQPRTLDVDIIYAGRLRLNQRDLVLPHPRWAERRFVVQPLADIRPRLRIPGTPKTVMQVLLSLKDRHRVTLLTPTW